MKDSKASYLDEFIQPVRIDFPIRNVTSISGEYHIAGWCYPPKVSSFGCSVWIFALPGAGETHRYYDLPIDGYQANSYNFASFFASRCIGVVTIDILGTGKSTWKESGKKLTLEVLAEINHIAVSQMRHKLKNGSLISQVPPLERVIIAGIGHSAGAGLCMAQQALYQSFDLVGNLGAACGDTVDLDFGEEPSFEITNGFISLHQDVYLPFFCLEDVPEEVKREYKQNAVSSPIGMLLIAQPEKLPNFAKQIAVPTLIVFGEYDIARHPEKEADYYSHDDITVYKHLGAAHHHNLANTRFDLWNYVFDWLSIRVNNFIK